MKERFTEWLLHVAEEMYLVAHGWKKVPSKYKGMDAHWIAPDTYSWARKAGQEHVHRHAVNSQKAATGNERREEAFKRAVRKSKSYENEY